MEGSPTNRNRSRVRLPTRRVLAIDAGSRRVKLLVMHSDFGRLRIMRRELVDLRTEGLVSAAEMSAHLGSVIAGLGHPPLAVVIPEHLSASHVIDLPPGPESDVKKQIGDEAIKLSGVSESKIIYDFARLESADSTRQHFWVTLCPEDSIRSQMLQLGIDHEDVCEVTTTANALITAHRVASPSAPRAILIHLGAQTTVLAGVQGGQGAFASSVQMGGDFFMRAIARGRGLTEEGAEELKRTENLFTGANACPELIEAVDGWVAEIKRQLRDALKQNHGLGPADSLEIIWSGSGFEQPGLVEQISKRGLHMRQWPQDTVLDGVSCPSGFEVALGSALQAFGYSSQLVSLLPEDYRQGWRKRVGRQRMEMASIVLIVLCAMALGFGIWRKLGLIDRKQTFLEEIRSTQEAADANKTLSAELLSRYRALRPVLAAQQNTKDTLKTLALLQQTRTNANLWYLVLADQQTYFSFSDLDTVSESNRAASATIGLDFIMPARAAALTNRFVGEVVPANPGFIAELCLTGQADPVRRTLQELVTSLKQNPLFSQADLLSDDLRRNVADPRLLVPDRHYVIALDFAEADFHQPVFDKARSVAGDAAAARRPRLGDATTHKEAR